MTAGPNPRRVVLVTGASGGLGRAVVPRLLAQGASVAAVYRDEARFDALRSLAAGGAAALTGFRADVTSEADVRSLVDGVVGRYGRIDALLHLAGGYRGGADVASTPGADWDFLMDLNLKSAFLCCRAVLPVMTGAGAGRIVCVAARPAVEAKGRSGSGAYAVSKAGVVVLVQTIAEEVRKKGVGINVIVPGTIDTPANRAAIPAGDFSRWTSPEAVAEVLLFLASDASAVTSGAVVPVYGRS